MLHSIKQTAEQRRKLAVIIRAIRSKGFTRFVLDGESSVIPPNDTLRWAMLVYTGWFGIVPVVVYIRIFAEDRQYYPVAWVEYEGRAILDIGWDGDMMTMEYRAGWILDKEG